MTLALNAVSDSDYFKTMKIPFAAGNNFKGRFAADSLSVILNEAAVLGMHLKEPIGSTITFSPQRLHMIGVIKDALSLNPFAPAEPAMFVDCSAWQPMSPSNERRKSASAKYWERL